MAVRPQTTEQQLANQLDNKNAGSKWEQGTDGHEIEPLPGEAVEESQVEQQFLSDFGDNLGEVEDIDVTQLTEKNIPPVNQNIQQIDNTGNEVVTADGQVINPQEREIPFSCWSKKKRETDSNGTNEHKEST